MTEISGLLKDEQELSQLRDVTQDDQDWVRWVMQTARSAGDLSGIIRKTQIEVLPSQS